MNNRYSCSIRFSIMFNRKKEGKKERPVKGREGMRQMGLLDMGGYYNFDPQTGAAAAIDDDDDIGLEAELLAITSGKAPPREKRPRKAPMSGQDLDSMIEASLRDPQSDEDDDEDLENDAELIAELQQLSPLEPPPSPPSPPKTSPKRPAPPAPSAPTTEHPVTSSYEPPPPSIESTLEQRLAMYKQALQNAAGDSAKTRRLDRGIKTINNLLKNARAGRTVDESDIPPEVAAGPPGAPKTPQKPPKSPPIPTEAPKTVEEEAKPAEKVEKAVEKVEKPVEKEPQPVAEPSDPMIDLLQWAENLTALSGSPEKEAPSPEEEFEAEKKMVFAMLAGRKKQYQRAALDAKRNHEPENAIRHMKIAKQFEVVIVALEQGQPIDLSQMPPPPPGYADEGHAGSPSPPSSLTTSSSDMAESVSEAGPPEPELFKAPPAPVSTLEALEQRREKYAAAMLEAEGEMNTSKSRRMGRIVKQYEGAIKLCKAGKAVPYDDLPDPPGFAPIPREGGSVASGGKSVGDVKGVVGKAAGVKEKESPVKGQGSPGQGSPGTSSAGKSGGGGGQTPRQNIQERQLQNLQQRQKLFRDAALEAKKKGDIEAAKEYLRISKGFNPMIEASKSGLPVNLDTAPIPPQVTRKKEMEIESEGFEVIEVSDCLPQGDRDEMYTKLEADLKAQIAMCGKNRDHFSQLGDINHSRKFQLLMEHANKDLMCLKYALKRGDPVPRFHYEMKTFNIVQCFTELNDNDCELTIVRGINYSCSNPKDVDTYVRFEFPFPSENSPKDKTATVKDTNNPDYNQTFMLSINRKARSLVRVFKRYSVKCEVMAKGGFFHSDHCLGIAHVKLAPLESKCFIHDSFDLMDGRKANGGKLEVKIRIREPLLSRQVEQIKEKWVVIDQYVIK